MAAQHAQALALAQPVPVLTHGMACTGHMQAPLLGHKARGGKQAAARTRLPRWPLSSSGMVASAARHRRSITACSGRRKNPEYAALRRAANEERGADATRRSGQPLAFMLQARQESRQHPAATGQQRHTLGACLGWHGAGGCCSTQRVDKRARLHAQRGKDNQCGSGRHTLARAAARCMWRGTGHRKPAIHSQPVTSCLQAPPTTFKPPNTYPSYPPPTPRPTSNCSTGM